MNKKHAYYAACFSLLFPGLGQLYLKETVRGMCLFSAFILLLVIPTTRLLIPLVAVYSAWEAFRLAKKQLKNVEDTEFSGGVIKREVAYLKGQPSRSRLALYVFVAVVGFIAWFFVFFLNSSQVRVQEQTREQVSALAAEVIRCSAEGVPSRLEECLGKEPGKKTVLQDLWGRDFHYKVTDYGFEIRSWGPDGEENTLDDYIYRYRVNTDGNNDPSSQAEALK